MQINISYSLIESLGFLWPVVTNLEGIKERPHLTDNPYCFLNQSGLPVKIDIRQLNSDMSISKEIPDDSTLNIGIDELEHITKLTNTRASRHILSDRKVIDIDVNPSEGHTVSRKKFTLRYKKIINIGIDTPDTHIFLLDFLNENSKGVEIKQKKTSQTQAKSNFFKKFEAFFIEEEDLKKYKDEEDINISSCFKCLRANKKHTNPTKMKESTMDKDYHNIALLVTEVLWNQELAQKTILIRSSITLINNLPTALIVSFTRDENMQNPLKEGVIEPMGKLSVPIVAVNKGQMFIRPKGKFEVSRVIGKIASGSVIETKNITLSGLKGIVDKNLLSRPSMTLENEKEDVYLDLGFIPLYCKNQDERLNEHFYCALTVNELPNLSPIRKNPNASSENLEVKKRTKRNYRVQKQARNKQEKTQTRRRLLRQLRNQKRNRSSRCDT